MVESRVQTSADWVRTHPQQAAAEIDRLQGELVPRSLAGKLLDWFLFVVLGLAVGALFAPWVTQ